MINVIQVTTKHQLFRFHRSESLLPKISINLGNDWHRTSSYAFLVYIKKKTLFK